MRQRINIALYIKGNIEIIRTVILKCNKYIVQVFFRLV